MAERPPAAPSTASLARLRAGFQRAVDEERRRLARALHDSALQTLTAASMNLSLAERESAGMSEQARQAVVDAQALIESCGRELRELSHELFPSLLGSAGLGPALRWLARQRGEDRLTLDLAELPRFGVSVELAAYRLVEESMGGLFEQSGAVRVRVHAPAEDVLEITMEGPARRMENGQVADLAMRQRIRAVGGRLRTRVISTGLRVEVRFPPSVPDIQD
ncbi:MAG TPA: histidine kinase [Polyangia bacterium]|nr:histidine kinase [Polyangia bacterium]